MQFTHHENHSFKVHNSVVFSMFTELGNHHHYFDEWMNQMNEWIKTLFVRYFMPCPYKPVKSVLLLPPSYREVNCDVDPGHAATEPAFLINLKILWFYEKSP